MLGDGATSDTSGGDASGGSDASGGGGCLERWRAEGVPAACRTLQGGAHLERQGRKGRLGGGESPREGEEGRGRVRRGGPRKGEEGMVKGG